jgi:hypothetical protein
LRRVRACTREDFVLPLQQNLGRPAYDSCRISSSLLLKRFFALGVDDLHVRVVLVIFFVFGTVLVVVRLDFMKLVNICGFYWRSLLPMVRFGIRNSLRNFCVLSQICFMHWLIRSSIDKGSSNIFFERLVLLHRINGSLFNL